MGLAGRSALGLVGVVLVAAAGLGGRWLAAARVQSVAPRARPARVEPASVGNQAAASRREVDAAAPDRDEPAPAPRDARPVAPEVERELDELATLLRSTGLLVTQVWDPRVDAVGARLDAACVATLTGDAATGSAPPARRLAALSLLRAAPELPEAFALTSGERALLRQAYDRAQPSPVVPDDAPERPLAVDDHRQAIARVAGACLVALGGERELASILDDVEAGDGVAVRSLRYARGTAAADGLIERLASAPHPGGTIRALLGLVEGAGPEAPLDLGPDLARRAAEVVAARWREQGAEGPDAGACASLLGLLDPALEARCWRALLDRGEVPRSRLARAVGSLARNASPDDLQRLDALMGQGDERERVAAAGALVRCDPGADDTAPLRGHALGVLEHVARAAADPVTRCDALYALNAEPSRVLPLAGELLGQDADPVVRHAAVVCLGRLATGEPRARELLERAAAADAAPEVRRAAEGALRPRTSAADR